MQTTIGVLGGTFNPIHIGHLIMAQDALDEFGLAKVLFVPSRMPPHKPALSALAPARHRLAMLERAIEGELRFEICGLELERPGVSYTIDTIRALRQMYQGATLLFLIGADTLPELHTWKDIDSLLVLCEFGVMPRPGFQVNSECLARSGLKPPWPERLLQNVGIGHGVRISASDIRHRLAEGLSIRYLVHPEVEMYITEHGLYRS